jgi:hypothetical protein
VLKCLPRGQDAITARRGPGESGSQPACGSQFHLQWTAETSVGARRPWLGGGILLWRKINTILQEVEKEEMGGEMAAVGEVDRVSTRSIFNNGSNERARNGSLKLLLGFWINDLIYPNGIESFISSISQ